MRQTEQKSLGRECFTEDKQTIVEPLFEPSLCKDVELVVSRLSHQSSEN